MAAQDLLIIDEAHTCVTDGTGDQYRMLRHELVTGLAKDPARRLILVTATPHSGKEDGFRNLLALLGRDLETVDLESVPGRRERLARHFVQRRRADIRSYLDESTPFPRGPANPGNGWVFRCPAAIRSCSMMCSSTPAKPVRDPEGGR